MIILDSALLKMEDFIIFKVSLTASRGFGLHLLVFPLQG